VIFLTGRTIVGLPLLAYGQDFGQKEKGLRLIEEASVLFCQAVPLEQTSSGSELNGQGKAELKGLVSKLAGLDIDASGHKSTNQSQGVMQKDLASAISDHNNCSVKVLALLSPAFLGNIASNTPAIVNAPSPDIANAASATPPATDTNTSCLAFIGTPPRTFQMKTVVIDRTFNAGSGVPPGSKNLLLFHIDHVIPNGPGKATFDGTIGTGSTVSGTIDGDGFSFTQNSDDGCDTFKTTTAFCSKDKISGELITFDRRCTNRFVHAWNISIEP
jgi:hypothetical protein